MTDIALMSPKATLKESPIIASVYIFAKSTKNLVYQYICPQNNSLDNPNGYANRVKQFIFPQGWDEMEQSQVPMRITSFSEFKFCLKDDVGVEQYAFCAYNSLYTFCIVSNYPWFNLSRFFCSIVSVRWHIGLAHKSRLYSEFMDIDELVKQQMEERKSTQIGKTNKELASKQMELLNFDPFELETSNIPTSQWNGLHLDESAINWIPFDKAPEAKLTLQDDTSSHQLPPDALVEQLNNFINSLNNAPFPFPGETFEIRSRTDSTYLDGNHTMTRPIDDEMPDAEDLRTLFNYLPTKRVIQLFQCVLEERRIMVIGDSATIVSECVMALQTLIYPFKWQHIFIPILPYSLIDYIMAPMPFIVGLHSSFKETIFKLPLENVVILDLNQGAVQEYSKASGVKEVEITLPKAYNLHTKIQEILPLQKNDIFESSAILETFVDYLVNIFGSCRKYMYIDETTRKPKFKEKEFFNSLPQYESILRFIKEAQHFEQWIQERLRMYVENEIPNGVFERKCARKYPKLYSAVYSNEGSPENIKKQRVKRWASAIIQKVSGGKHVPVIQHQISKNPKLEKVARESAQKLSEIQRKSSQAFQSYKNRLIMQMKSDTMFDRYEGILNLQFPKKHQEQVLEENMQELQIQKKANRLLSQDEHEDLFWDQHSKFGNQFLDLQTQLSAQFEEYNHSTHSVGKGVKSYHQNAKTPQSIPPLLELPAKIPKEDAGFNNLLCFDEFLTAPDLEVPKAPPQSTSIFILEEQKPQMTNHGVSNDNLLETLFETSFSTETFSEILTPTKRSDSKSSEKDLFGFDPFE